ncbi:hypothetical protein SAMN06269173_107105 [Hymenobacter mucosus]|uniref:Uncharacterized protein n=1 Tax=Hymenobacter mucosus TaxID=1411120 RepID=A0A238ZE35_9BACT|nr:hypothetical protein SAMN06269173_107105 [Hymenobacter mucosus]
MKLNPIQVSYQFSTPAYNSSVPRAFSLVSKFFIPAACARGNQSRAIHCASSGQGPRKFAGPHPGVLHPGEDQQYLLVAVSKVGNAGRSFH